MDLSTFDLAGLVILWRASANNKELRLKIENDIQLRIAGKNSFSREYLFELSVIKKHAITFVFYPGTEAFNSYGAEVNTSLIFSEDELKELTQNYMNKQNTSGKIRAKQLAGDELSEEQKAKLEGVGFFTNEIFKILHV